MDSTIRTTEELLLRYAEGEVTQDEKQEIEQWIASSEANEETARHIYYLSFAAKTLDTLKRINVEDALKKVKRKMRRNRQRRWMQRTAVSFAVSALLFALYFCIRTNSRNREVLTEIRARPGMTASVTLPDETRVTLNSNSAIIYPVSFDKKSRDVRLEGEAYFEVTQDARPFQVATPQEAVVKVYGTQFNVEAYATDDKVTATLVEGSIAMTCKNKKNVWTEQKIRPGQEAVYAAKQRSIKVAQADVEAAISWKEGKLVFRNTPFKEVLDILSKRFDVEFAVKNPDCYEASFTGTLEKLRLERVLEYISVSSTIRFQFVESHDIRQEKQKIEVY